MVSTHRNYLLLCNLISIINELTFRNKMTDPQTDKELVKLSLVLYFLILYINLFIFKTRIHIWTLLLNQKKSAFGFKRPDLKTNKTEERKWILVKVGKLTSFFILYCQSPFKLPSHLSSVIILLELFSPPAFQLTSLPPHVHSFQYKCPKISLSYILQKHTSIYYLPH